MPEGPYRNTFLRHLDLAVVKRIKLTHTMMDLKQELLALSGPIDRMYFVEEGIASMTAPFSNGTEVEVGTFGYESVIGLSSLMGTKISNVRVFMQMRGHGFTCPVHEAQLEFERNSGFRNLILFHFQAQFAQSAQNAACNALHKHEQRMAKWLLVCADRIDRETLDLSHEFLAQMLGSTRSTVTLTAGVLKRKGLIDYKRGCIRILDREKLQKYACECYAITRQQLEALRSVVGIVT